jgi:dimethylhistidine N-methyltransferase
MTGDPTFAAEVREYLQRSPRQLPSKYFYDPLGSALFEAICRLPWYRITRAESTLIALHAGAIVEPFDGPLSLAELGCGSGEKLAAFIDSAAHAVDAVHLIDVSAAALENAAAKLRQFSIPVVVSHLQTYEDGLRRLGAHRDGPMLVLFLGSNIGNFDPPADEHLLCRIRACLRTGDALLLGTDLMKPENELLLAYDDPLQVTAAFNLNILRRINDELGGTFDLDAFAHRAVWNAHESRMEMHLISLAAQVVRIAACDLEIAFEPNELIWTESSYKYTAAKVLEIGRSTGFGRAEQWVDVDAGFALTRFMVED